MAFRCDYVYSNCLANLNHDILHAKIEENITIKYRIHSIKVHPKVARQRFLYTMSKDLKRNLRNSSKSYFENNSSWYYEQWFQFTTSYNIDDSQKKCCNFRNERKITISNSREIIL